MNTTTLLNSRMAAKERRRRKKYEAFSVAAFHGKRAEIKSDLRAVFYIDGDLVITVDIRTHDVYKQ